MPDNIVDIARYGLIGLFSIVIFYFIGLVIIGGNMYPMLQKLAPHNDTAGIGPAQYAQSSNDIWLGLKWSFYILIGFIFLFIAVKLLYEKESTTAGY